MAKWIEFREVPTDPHKDIKTRVWYVLPEGCNDLGRRLGRVAWFTRWRKYCYFPIADTVYEQDCLRDIAQFCEDETRKHREANKAMKEAANG